MKTNILNSTGLKLAIFGLTLALPSLSAQAQKYPIERLSIQEADRLIKKSDEILAESEIYPNLQKMIDGGIFTDGTQPTATQVSSAMAIRKVIQDQIGVIKGDIKKLENKGDHPVLNQLKDQKEKLESSLAALEKRLGEFENRGQNRYDAMSEEEKKAFEIKAQMATYEKFTEIDKVEDLKQSKEKGVQFPMPFHHTPKKKTPISDTVDFRNN